uniref:Galectin n=1 Tax=Syphacia muris TaxID=451379 RepID=A0A0N5B0W9_9BILA
MTMPIPILLNLTSPIKFGQTIRIIATALPHAKRFHINFYNNDFSSNYIPIHLSFRWDEGIFSNRVVYNTQKNGTWNSQEVRMKHPLKRAIQFDLRIRFLDNSIQIDCLLIDGDLATIRYIHYGGEVYKIPYVNAFSTAEYKQIDISGLSKGKCISFGFYDVNDNCVFLISIRFNEKAVVRNTQIDHRWGKEERDGGFPIRPKHLYDIDTSS